VEVVALAGGTGSAKLLRGLAGSKCRLTVVANIGDNAWMHGLYVCPDIDIALYTLAGVANRRRGWGIQGDTFAALRQLRRLGEEAWFSLGDRDLATHILRTKWLREGETLTEVTDRLRRAFRVRMKVLPVSDSHLETRILTEYGELGLQEFWVRDKGRPKVIGVRYAGVARMTRAVSDSLSSADRIIVCPANPVTSIGPLLAVRGVRKALSSVRAKVTAVSPMIGSSPFSGPAGRLLNAIARRPDSLGVAGLYNDFARRIFIHRSDSGLVPAITQLGMECRLSETRMTGPSSERRLARELME
jgi:LPPG:FO 2-phospho-L-lactate transferase